MKFSIVALVALSAAVEAKRIGGNKTRRRAQEASCLGDFSVTFTGPCTHDAVKGAVENLVIGDTTGTCKTVAEELAALFGTTDTALMDAEIDALCTGAAEEQVAGFKPFKDISKLGDTHDREFLNGGTFWNEQVETAVGEYVLQSDLSRILMVHDTEAGTNGIGWPTSAAISSVHDCAVDAVMCCYVSDRQAGDGGGTCAGPGCFFAEPEDNSDICYMDMSNAPKSARVANGVAIYDKKDHETDSEGNAYCHGFAWKEADYSSKYAGNLLFEVAMKQNLYDKGYVQNVPGAPMCGCIEKMPVVSKSACSSLSATEEWTFSATGSALAVDFETVQINYDNCGGADLADHFNQLTGGDLSSYIVGEGNCHSAVDSFAATNLGLKRSTLAIAEVIGHPSKTAVSVVFTKDVADAAAAVENFEISGPGGILTISEARIGLNLNTVVLTTADQTFGTEYTLTVKGVVAKRVAPMVTVPLDSAATFVGTDYGYANNVPEAEDYLLLYNLDIPTTPTWGSSLPAYTYGDTPFLDYSRVAYWMELESELYGHEWVWVSMPEFSKEREKLGIPVASLSTFYNGLLDNAKVYTNQKDIAADGSLEEQTVNIEFWPNNYGRTNTRGIEGASSATYDFGDERSTGGSYGSFQVHVPSIKTTLFALNNWRGPVDIGIGNQRTDNPDWTFAKNGGIYTLKNLAVLVNGAPLGAADLGPANLATTLDDAQGFEMIYSLDIPDLPNFSNRVPYTIDYSIFRPNGSFERVAYYLELTKDGVTEWVWVSMKSFTDDAKKLGVPTYASGAVFQGTVTEMNVYSNVDGMEAHNITGGVEFWPHNYGTADALDMGASDTLYDFGDTRATGGNHGSMQVHAHSLGHGTNLISFNNWNRGQQAELGIGNNENGQPDWTFAQNSAKYAVKKLEVFIK
uniref:Uncharacterized protein n=2 Tax=Helicotheca tamesis TaxID=374047 RepID=A0A7S2IBD9_9STRA|mmetsp:Transcript_738/g.972  ORF Transcript_738/g.972 Transcript_738/m.972 type:complete len:913 (+) Transcript_738:79-2817(+)|eukprot:CAMPEP_0185729468 /NCGR_PEP_ID=MMETSP1171-20130828/5942_1 /TAXON_ID=374046 /ORGANISM="Helicotheca tamensis, Strain CCMP826" /LENGTH=912 /DNA_ID=CAMNT_0028398313 /DNA_START=14 /DNA_END=2752 /DNA_ORIENTATION=+